MATGSTRADNHLTTKSKSLVSLLLATAAWLLAARAFADTPVQFYGTETNSPLQRILTLVVVPPSDEQLRGTNLNIQPNIIVKPNGTNGYPIVSLVSADYDVYVAGNREVFRISVPDTNVVQRWDLLIKNGLTTYNYTNPLPVLAGAIINNLYTTNLITTNLYSTYITNQTLYSTNIFAVTENLSLLVTTNLYATYNTNLYAYETNLYSTNIITTNLYATYATNFYLYTTNLFSTNIVSTNIYAVSNFFLAQKGGTIVATNVSFTYSTNLYSIITNLTANYITNTLAYSTNLYVTTNYVQNLFVTNITVTSPGGLTNVNATPKTLAWWDVNDSLSSIPTASGVLTNDGAGNIGFSSVFSLTELDANSAYLTNTYVFKTNMVLQGDSNGKIAGVANGSGVLQNDGSGGLSWVVGPPPGGTAGGRLTGSYPNPSFATYASSQLASDITDETGVGLVVFSGGGTVTNLLIKGDQYGSNALSVTVNRVDITNNLGGFTQTGVNNTNTGTVGAGGGFIGNLTGNVTGTATLVTQPAYLTFGSDSNSIAMSTNINNVYFFVANKAVSLSNVTASISGQMTYGDLIVSNSLATSITNYETIPGAKVFGVNSATTATNAIIIPAAKEAFWHIECRGNQETNVFVCLQQ